MIFCTYCNQSSPFTKDHVIPKSYSGNPSFAERYVVPCCTECNILLGAAPCHTVEERAAFLFERYSRRFKAELATPDWTAKELKELSPTFRKKIAAKESHKKLINSKLLSLRHLAGHWLVNTG